MGEDLDGCVGCRDLVVVSRVAVQTVELHSSQHLLRIASIPCGIEVVSHVAGGFDVVAQIFRRLIYLLIRCTATHVSSTPKCMLVAAVASLGTVVARVWDHGTTIASKGAGAASVASTFGNGGSLLLPPCDPRRRDHEAREAVIEDSAHVVLC